MSAIVPDAALCLSCNYPLRGLESRRCPECGRGFDPDEPMSMNLGRPLDRTALMLLRPIGWWGTASLRVLATAGVVGPAWLTPARGWACLWLLAWGAFMAACWVRGIVRFFVVQRYRQPLKCLRIDDPFRMRARKAFAWVTLLVLTQLPFRVALLMSRPWLDHRAYFVWAVLPANVEPRQTPGLEGLVMVRRIEPGANHVTFHLFGGGAVSYYRSKDGQRLEFDWWIDWD